MAERSPRETPQGGEPDSRDLRITFGENLRAARLKAGLTQAEVAACLGLTQQYISLVEAGRENLTLTAMMSLARAIGYDVSIALRRARRTRRVRKQ